MIVTQVETPDNVAVLAIEHRSTQSLRTHPDAEAIPMSEEDEKALRDDIAKNGILHPLDLTPDGRILDGIHRWRYAQELEILSIPCIVFHYQEPEEESNHALKANLKRRHLNEGQRAMLYLKVLENEKTLAQKRTSKGAQVAQLKRWGVSTNTEVSTNGTDKVLPRGSTLSVPLKETSTSTQSSKPRQSKKKQTDNGEAAEKAAEKANVSPRTMYRGQAVANASPTLANAVMQGEMSVNKAYQQVKAEENAQEVKKLQAEERPLTDQEIMKKLSIKLQPYDVWSFSECDDRFGHDYPGRVPGQLIAHCLYFWTEQGDIVLDPMAGSGTTIDVCKVLNRHVLAYDAHPCRDDIALHNLAEQGWPEQTSEAKLIFWDPPYFKKVDDGYGDQSISRLPRQAYLDFFERMATTIPDAFHGSMAFLMSDYNDEENLPESIWLHDYIKRFIEHGWQVERIIHVPLSTQQIHPDIVKKFREAKRLARLSRGLVVMGR